MTLWQTYARLCTQVPEGRPYKYAPSELTALNLLNVRMSWYICRTRLLFYRFFSYPQAMSFLLVFG
jgi:hypothetical protein